jgi:hypothetical protein
MKVFSKLQLQGRQWRRFSGTATHNNCHAAWIEQQTQVSRCASRNAMLHNANKQHLCLPFGTRSTGAAASAAALFAAEATCTAGGLPKLPLCTPG